jgi:hypothetical protein
MIALRAVVPNPQHRAGPRGYTSVGAVHAPDLLDHRQTRGICNLVILDFVGPFTRARGHDVDPYSPNSM